VRDTDHLAEADPSAQGERALEPELRERALEPELRAEHARALAWTALNRKERTVAEMARLLAGKRVEAALIDEVVGELIEQGYLDDAGYARRFADDRRLLDSWGAERIQRRLRALGVDREHIAEALGAQPHEQELEAALTLLARRFPEPPSTPRDCERALGMLVRKGYELELAHDALRRHAGARELD
jgi:regulatory protein